MKSISNLADVVVDDPLMSICSFVPVVATTKGIAPRRTASRMQMDCAAVCLGVK